MFLIPIERLEISSGVWRSLFSALDLGSRGRWLESNYPEYHESEVLYNLDLSGCTAVNRIGPDLESGGLSQMLVQVQSP